MQALCARFRQRRWLEIGAAGVATLVGAAGLIYWLYMPLVEPTTFDSRGLSVKRRALLIGAGKFLSWSPDSQILATTSGHYSDESAILWNRASGKKEAALPLGFGAAGLAWSPDGNTLATGSSDGTTILWDPKTGQRLMSRRDEVGRIHDLAWSPDGTTLAIGSDNMVVLWDVVSGEARGKLEWNFTTFINVAWSPDGQALACGSHGITLLWDLVSTRPRATLSGSVPRWRPDGKDLATFINDSVILWEPSTATERAKLTGDGVGIACMAWNPDGRLLATATWDNDGYWRDVVPDRLLGKVSSVTIWDTTTLQARFKLIGHRRETETLAWSPDGRYLASGSWDASVIIWDVSKGTRAAVLNEGIHEVIQATAWSPDGRTLATAFGSIVRKTILWDIVRTEAATK
jgi:WD40 repeat protein